MSEITDPPIQPQFLCLHPDDNVAVSLADLPQQSLIVLEGAKISLQLEQPIKFGHKFAVSQIKQGQLVMKYGIPIGVATVDIGIGEHVHLHNLRSLQMKGDEYEGIPEGGWKNRNS